MIPDINSRIIYSAVKDASAGGAKLLFTPEMSNIIDNDRNRASAKIVSECDDETLSAAKMAAEKYQIWVVLGSLAIRRDDGRFANRSYVINSNGDVVGRYDKIHMFDVNLNAEENWKESAVYSPGTKVGVVDGTPLGRLGLTICYDIRFPALFEKLGQLKCDAIAIPAAFTVPTGRAHWHVLQRARAIESCAFVLSSAQVGTHDCGRRTYGHSIAIDPWGNVLADMGGQRCGIEFVDLDLSVLTDVRRQIPCLDNKRTINS